MNDITTGTVSIHGRTYKTVALRVQEFREQHPADSGWCLRTEIVSIDDDKVVMLATVISPEGRVVGTGYAEEYRNASKINSTSALENCETSALGRALSACGYGGSEYASANEVIGAISAQNESSEVLKAHNEMVRNWFDSIHCIKTCISTQNWQTAVEAWNEIPDEDKRALWVAPTKGGIFTTTERAAMKGEEWAAARRELMGDDNAEK